MLLPYPSLRVEPLHIEYAGTHVLHLAGIPGAQGLREHLGGRPPSVPAGQGPAGREVDVEEVAEDEAVGGLLDQGGLEGRPERVPPHRPDLPRGPHGVGDLRDRNAHPGRPQVPGKRDDGIQQRHG